MSQGETMNSPPFCTQFKNLAIFLSFITKTSEITYFLSNYDQTDGPDFVERM